jgi:hypothetical protein
MDSLNPVYLFVGAAAAAMAYNSDTVVYQIRPDPSYFEAISASQPKGVFGKKPDEYKRLKRVSQKVSKIAKPKIEYLRNTAGKSQPKYK